MKDPVVDPARLQSLLSVDLSSARAQTLLDACARDAAAVLGCPMGLVSIVLDGAQWFAGASGLSGWLAETRGTPVEWAFCADVVRAREPLVVANAPEAERYRRNPLVEREGVTFYAGVPLLSEAGHVIGSLCAISPEPGQASEAQLGALGRLAADLMLALRREQG